MEKIKLKSVRQFSVKSITTSRGSIIHS